MFRAAPMTLGVASMGFFLVTLDVSIVNLALPSIQADLGGGTSSQQWILDGYTLLFASFLLLAGNFTDRVGAKRAYVGGIALFGVTSLLCALAPNIEGLIAARCAQGAAAALMLPASMALVGEAYPVLNRRTRALGVWAAGGAVASAVGPLLGGTLSTVNWRLVFLINVPVCLVMIVAAARVPTSDLNPRPFDWAGQVLALVALGGILFGLIEGGAIGYGNPVIIVSSMIGILALAGFVVLQTRVRHPMVPLQLFRTSPMRVAFFVGFTFIFVWFGSVFVASLYLQQHLDLPPVVAGLIFLPAAAVSFAGNLASGPLVNRFGPRVPVALGMASLVCGLVGLALAANMDSAVLTALFLVLIGSGGSVATPPLAGVVLAGAAPGQAGIASAVANTFRQIGGALGIALCGVLIAAPWGFIHGMRVSLVVAAVLGITAGIMGTTLLPGAVFAGGRGR